MKKNHTKIHIMIEAVFITHILYKFSKTFYIVTSQEPANYDFSYEVQDSASSLDFGHSEKRLAEQASGSYHVLLPDGRTQIVDYEAGPDGYRPQVHFYINIW